MMSTPIQNLQKSTAHLEVTHPSSRLLSDYKKQLADWQRDGDKTTQDLYFSGRPMTEQASAEGEATHPMQPAIDQYEKAMTDMFTDKPEKAQSK